MTEPKGRVPVTTPEQELRAYPLDNEPLCMRVIPSAGSQTTDREARDIVEALYAMGSGLTMNDRYKFMAECLSKARSEGRQEMARYVNNFCARAPLCSRSFE